MLEAHLGFQDIEHGLDDEALAQQDLVGQGHEIVLHVAPNAGDEVQATPPECVEQGVADIALVGVELACQMLGDLVEPALSAVLPGVIFSATIWPLWLMTKCSLRPKNHPMLVLPRAARPSNTL